MPMPNQIDWNGIQPGSMPLCLVGAGFPLGMLKDKPPSTGDIIQYTVNTYNGTFPALTCLVNNPPANLALNFVWEKREDMAKKLIPFYDQIKGSYASSGISKMNNFFYVYESLRRTKETALWVLLDLELKKMISTNYAYNSISPWNRSACANIYTLLNNDVHFTWLSLNYDLVLEKLLLDQSGLSSFNGSTTEVNYAFAPLLIPSVQSHVHRKHLLIKPHGSVNVSFQTKWDQSTTLHSVKFVDSGDFRQTLSPNNYGYTTSIVPFLEERAWLIGYLPDDAKDELNSAALFSDMAHDLCKWNMATASYSFYHASSLLIIGYSMPTADEWIWKRVENIPNRDINVYILSGKDSKSIVQKFLARGFKHVNIVNGGWI
jgi:hypothetical protein